MPGLSTPIGELRSQYGVVVVGSGYGGAIAAYVMSRQATDHRPNLPPRFSVCLLERGLERQSGDFPASLSGALGQVQADTRFGHVGPRTGLFDFRINPDVSVLVGCGLGGTSLINAGVMLRPIDDVFTHKDWPRSLRDPDALASEFRIVHESLGAGPVPLDVPLAKVTRLFEAGGGGIRPDIAVSFKTEINEFGIQLQRCVLCGDCMTGCNHSAKNTLMMNFLPGAASLGAAIFCGVDVRAVERGNDGLWRLRVRIEDRAFKRFGDPHLTIRARAVFLAAGTLGSTEILLRSRSHGLSCSDRLGQCFSGNGDFMAFGYNARDPVDGIGFGAHVPRDASVGPLIAGMLDERERSSGATIQEGAIPGVLAPVLRFTAPIMARASSLVSDAAAGVFFKHIGRELDSLIRGAHHGALRRTQTFLAMSRDDGIGTMGLVNNRLRIAWEHAGHQRVFGPVARRLAELTRAMKGRYVINPFWSRLFGRRLVTVHPLGGCRMGDDPDTSVVNERGQVFDHDGKPHDGLYVCDGSIVPIALGTNPALTISALALRIARQAADPVAELTKDEKVEKKAPGRITPSEAGLRYAERLTGRMDVEGQSTAVELLLHISTESIRTLIEDKRHRADVIGVVRAPDLQADRQELRVFDSAFEVMIDDPNVVDTKLLKYTLKLESTTTGERFGIEGVKVINLATCRRGLWRAASHVPFDVLDAQGRAVGHGYANSTVRDTIRMLASAEVTHERRLRTRLGWLLRYVWFFLDSIIQARFWAITRTPPINPFDRPPLLPPPGLKLGERIFDRRQRPGRFRLTPFTSAAYDKSKPPVILAPGFGMSADAFLIGEPSITEFLCEKGYQVWLFDYRASDRLEASLGQFTLDELALKDFPEAIKAVCEKAGKRVHLVFHCVASMTTLMGLLAGTLTAEHIQSAVLSQSFAFIDHPCINRLKAKLRLPRLLRYLNFRPVLTADFDVKTKWPAKLLDRILRFYPSDERCTAGVCRRLLFMYGEVIRHDQLNHQTHDRMYDMFGRANLTTFDHLGKMIARGRLVNKRGEDAYLTAENGRNVRVPITLLQGTANGLFRPPGGKDTHEWLIKNRHPEMNAERFTLVPLEGYGHLDTFVGRHVAFDVYPIILDALRRWERST